MTKKPNPIASQCFSGLWSVANFKFASRALPEIILLSRKKNYGTVYFSNVSFNKISKS